MFNRIYTELEKAKKDKGFIDLTVTNFANRFTYPAGLLEEGFKKYIKDRRYDPVSKGLERSRKAVSAYYNKEGLEVNPENILLTASTSESYQLIFNTLLETGDKILLPRPCYPLFEQLANYSRLGTVFYDLDPKNGWQPDLISIKKAIDLHLVKAMVLVSPNNPTGSIIRQNVLEEIMEIAAKEELIIISDEVFDIFKYTPGKLPRAASFAKDVVCFTLNGISKMFALPDLKLAWIAASGPVKKLGKIVDELETANDTFLNANYFSQSLLPDLFDNSREFQKQMLSELGANLKFLEKFMDQEKDLLEMVVPEGGIHCLLTLKKIRGDEEQFTVDLINKAKIFMHPAYFYDYKDGEGRVSLVFSLLAGKEELEGGLEKLVKFIK
jgi:alanine-synthesizing transaminase